jgi:hypothetical protein
VVNRLASALKENGQRSSTTGWRVGIQERPPSGTVQSGWPMFSANVKKRSWWRMSVTENDWSSVASPRS